MIENCYASHSDPSCLAIGNLAKEVVNKKMLGLYVVYIGLLFDFI